MKFFTLLFSVAVALALPTLHANPTEIWPGNAPGETAEKQEHRKDTTTEPNVIRLTQVTHPTLEIFRPQAHDNGNAVIVCPGGGYSILAYDKEGTDVARRLSQQGFTAFTLAYRVPGNPDGALQDLQRAVRLVRKHFSKGKVGVIGFSAGAHLAARAATHSGEDTYPKTDEADTLNARPDFAMLIYPAYLARGPKHSLSPELKISKDTPPMFIFGTLDDYAYSSRSALVMAEAMRAQNRPVDLHYLSRGGHGYGMRTGAGLIWPPLAENWLKALKFNEL